jgi:alpha-tubulin suppressor-like RCC1 family protein
VHAGAFTSFFVTKDKRLFGCGLADSGELGFKPKSSKEKFRGAPEQIKIIDEKQTMELKAFYTGSNHSLALAR